MDAATKNRSIHTLFVTALQAEATPLIEHYRLKALKTRAFRCYQSANVSLIVCGIGETAAASATAYTLGFLPAECVAINIGIAGADHPTGKLFHASVICRQSNPVKTTTTDKSTAANLRNFYPQLPFKGDLPRLKVVTLEQPRTDYRKDCCFEMEAYGFCFAARKFLAAEQIHCLKIISDNPAQPLAKVEKRGGKNNLEPENKNIDNSVSKKTLPFNAATISSLVQARIDAIVNFSNQLATRCENPESPACTEDTSAVTEYLSKIEIDNNIQLRFTTSQQQRLQRLLQRYTALDIALPEKFPQPIREQKRHPVNAKNLLNLLETGIAGYLPGYKDISANTQQSVDSMHNAATSSDETAGDHI